MVVTFGEKRENFKQIQNSKIDLLENFKNMDKRPMSACCHKQQNFNFWVGVFSYFLIAQSFYKNKIRIFPKKTDSKKFRFYNRIFYKISHANFVQR